METLHAFLDRAARRFPDRVAVDEPNGATITYRDLDALTDRVRDRLRHAGVGPGDRVGVYMHKSIDSVASIFGILKCGAAYVPVDPEAPAPRCAYTLDDCSVKAILTESRLATALQIELEYLGPAPRVFSTPATPDGLPLAAMLDAEDAIALAPTAETVHPSPDDLAYILYTSGSTGKPKGVMLSHRAGTSYVDWCSSVFAPTEMDVFSSHAPFHFDLSILDVYLPIKHGARLVLIGESLGKEPLALARVIAEKRISMWYSVPSILSLLAQYGKLDRYDFSALRVVNFAGEVFPVPQFHTVKAAWPHPRYVNLFGPTETNVCTYYEVPAHVPADRTQSFAIGRSCTNVVCRVVDPDGNTVAPGDEGELVVMGAGVMQGYWNLPAINAQVFLTDGNGTRWYRTGDLVVEDAVDGYLFHGRRDRMVKRRGYRIELGEIEAGLATHAAVREVAVVAVADPKSGTRIKAFLTGQHGERLSVIQLKQFSAERLPRYMIPDEFGFVDGLPRTSTDKIDYQALTAQA
ncbi:MAG TPA: amino acid adenylation domain-containing protein [Gemmatimonadaceae bacterium]|nr:amino acid adenylation domain-containing protein [Gemmatimonadaceae bacterium]